MGNANMRNTSEEKDAPVVQQTDNEFAQTNEEESYLDIFYKEVTAINLNIETLQSLIESVKQIHVKILSSPQNDNNNIMEDLETLISEVTKSAAKVRNRLKVIEQNITKLSLEEQCPNIYFKIISTHHSMLFEKFSDTIVQYNEAHNDYKQRYKSMIQNQLESRNVRRNCNFYTTIELEEMISRQYPTIFNDGIITESVLAKLNLRQLEDRHQELLELEDELRRLHDIVYGTSETLSEQGEIIDHIEVEVSRAVDSVNTGKENIREAYIEHKRTQCFIQ